MLSICIDDSGEKFKFCWMKEILRKDDEEKEEKITHFYPLLVKPSIGSARQFDGDCGVWEEDERLIYEIRLPETPMKSNTSDRIGLNRATDESFSNGQSSVSTCETQRFSLKHILQRW